MQSLTKTIARGEPMPIFRYIGGKQRLAKQIIAKFPEHRTYVEPFCGGAAVFFMKPQSKVEVINDINGDIVNLYRIVQNHLEEFLRQYEYLLVSRETFLNLRSMDYQGMTDIQRAVRFFYLQKQGFGGFGKSFGIDKENIPKLNIPRLNDELSLARKRLIQCYIEHLDWAKCIEKYDSKNTLFYLDPPYWELTGYGVPFEFSEYQKIKDYMKSAKGKFIFSINKHPDIVELFKDFSQEDITISYTCNSGEHRKASEALIWSW